MNDLRSVGWRGEETVQRAPVFLQAEWPGERCRETERLECRGKPKVLLFSFSSLGWRTKKGKQKCPVLSPCCNVHWER